MSSELGAGRKSKTRRDEAEVAEPPAIQWGREADGWRGCCAEVSSGLALVAAYRPCFSLAFVAFDSTLCFLLSLLVLSCFFFFLRARSRRFPRTRSWVLFLVRALALALRPPPRDLAGSRRRRGQARVWRTSPTPSGAGATRTRRRGRGASGADGAIGDRGAEIEVAAAIAAAGPTTAGGAPEGAGDLRAPTAAPRASHISAATAEAEREARGRARRGPRVPDRFRTRGARVPDRFRTRGARVLARSRTWGLRVPGRSKPRSRLPPFPAASRAALRSSPPVPSSRTLRLLRRRRSRALCRFLPACVFPGHSPTARRWRGP